MVSPLFVSVAQGTEHRSPKAGVGGSNPLWDTIKGAVKERLTNRATLAVANVALVLAENSHFVLIPFLCQQEIADIAVLDSVSAHVELIQRDNIFRVVVADIVIRAELTPDDLIGCQQIGNLNI